MGFLEEFWARAPGLSDAFADLDPQEECDFLDEDYTMSKEHADYLAAAPLTQEQKVRFDRVPEQRDLHQARVEKLARGA